MPKVIVGCKLPHGYLLELGKPGDPDYWRQLAKGTNAAPSTIVGAHGITHNVEEAKFDEWLRRNANLDPVKRGLIWKEASLAEAHAHAIDREDEKTGLERLDPEKSLPKELTVMTDD